MDRSSTVIAKEPEGTCLISALICFLGFFFKSLFLHFSHAKRNTRQNNTNVKKKKKKYNNTQTQTKNICRSWGFVSFLILFPFDLIRPTPTSPTNDWNNSRLDDQGIHTNQLIYWETIHQMNSKPNREFFFCLFRTRVTFTDDGHAIFVLLFPWLIILDWK